jgi:hypothetical protein
VICCTNFPLASWPIRRTTSSVRHAIRLIIFCPTTRHELSSGQQTKGVRKSQSQSRTMLSEAFITSIRAQPKSANTAIAKDVGIYLHELHPEAKIKSSFKKSSTPVNALAVSSTHIFAAQADKAVVHVYSRDRGNQEALISFPERIHCITLVGDGVLVLGTSEGRVILWEVSVLREPSKERL